ncbi:MAG: hypothetical protein FJ225_09435 [Lentisphaerae bacterium]|nr:hypothetical protein [Lentisphaerota bacterium]
MPELPDAAVRSVPAAQRRRLRRWLAEWELDRALRGEPEAETCSPAAPPLATAGEAAPAPGQIRLLPPYMPGAAPRPAYVLVLAADGPDAYLVAPFGRFAEPALPGEMLTGRGEPCLRVLCLWNAIRMSRATAGRAWLAGSLSARQQSVAVAAYAHVARGAPLSARLVARMGPPLCHPFDPRHAYLRQERARFAALREPARAVSGPLTYPDAGAGSELRKAAEDRAEYGE